MTVSQPRHMHSMADQTSMRLLLLAAAILVAAVSAAAQDVEEPEVAVQVSPPCAVYHPTECWYQSPCSTPFMEEDARPRPNCKNSCCTADPGPGSWHNDPAAPAHKVYGPASGCEYFQYKRKEVLEYFQEEATDILVVGDSFMRQLFVRILHLMRGQERVVDYKIHTHATYATCDVADNFMIAPAYTEKLAANKDKQFYAINTFFLGHNVTSDARWSDCSKPPMQVHYMFGSTFRQQVRNLERYAKKGYYPATRVDIIISVMFWTHEFETPQEWLDALGAIKAQNFVRRIFLLGIPTARVDPKLPHYVEAYKNRNRMMKEWANNQTSGAYYIDFDVISTAENIPAACAGFNKHYACHLRGMYDTPADGGSSDGGNYFRDPYLQVPLGALFSSEDGECYDDVNAAVWQLYFNVAMKDGGKSQAAKRKGSSAMQGNSGSRKAMPAPKNAMTSYTEGYIDRLWMRGLPG